MEKIFFSKNLNSLIKSKFGSDFGQDTIVVYHAMYDKPEVTAGHILEWEKYKGIYDNYHPKRIVLIGLNRMIIPSNRCDFIHAYLTVMTPDIPNLVIDTAPFIGEPWRLYFHYQLASCFSGFGANYSYPIEGEWLRWFRRDLDECKFSPKNLKSLIVETYTDLPRLDTEFMLYPPSKEESEWYAEAKAHEFERFRSAKMIIQSLVKTANQHFGLDISYDSYLDGGIIQVPDIGIYRFMVEENYRRRDIYNLFTI